MTYEWPRILAKWVEEDVIDDFADAKCQDLGSVSINPRNGQWQAPYRDTDDGEDQDTISLRGENHDALVVCGFRVYTR
jgi:hypothetical protein